jgi:hypothetical protein
MERSRVVRGVSAVMARRQPSDWRCLSNSRRALALPATDAAVQAMSALCQKQTFRAAERTSLFDHFVGTADCHAGGRSGHSFRTGASPVAMFWNDSNPGMVLRAHEAQNAAGKLGLNLQSIGVHDLISFDTAFAAIESGRFNALLILVDPFTREHRQRIVDFAAQRRLPAIYESREFVDAGGLISYGPSLTALERRVADYVNMIFKGSNPADLPVELPTKFEMVIGMKAAKALGLTLSQSVVMRADELIE